MIGEEVAGITVDRRLTSGEVAALASGDFKQPGAIGFPALNRNRVFHKLYFMLLSGDAVSVPCAEVPSRGWAEILIHQL